MLHDGETRRSEDAFSDAINRGMSAAAAAIMYVVLESFVRAGWTAPAIGVLVRDVSINP